MLVENFVVEARISNSKACKLSGVTIRVLATGYCSFDQTMFQKLLIKVACVSAEISEEVADLGTDSSIFMTDQSV